MTELQTIRARLEQAAFKATDNFCYSCYKVVHGDRCGDCFTDDFMRHLAGVGVEYGTEWVIEHLISQHCQPVDSEEMFAEMLDECYPQVTVGNCTFSPSAVMAECDPVAFRIGVSENLDSLREDCQLYELNGDYYNITDIEDMLDDLESDSL